MEKDNRKKLPKLPRGMGTYDYTAKGSIRYRKNITQNGITKSLSVVGSSISEVNKLMQEKERKTKKEIVIHNNSKKTQTLKEGMNEWLRFYKSQEVIERSYDRIESTFLTHIANSNLGNMQEQAITSDNIQSFMLELQNHKYNTELSYSSRKKVYELLSQYFKYKYIKEPFLNPMLTVTKPIKNVENIKDEELIVWNDEEIECLCKEAVKPIENGISGYKRGCGIVFIMWIFCRIGEAQALQWKDIDIENETVSITKSYSKVKIRNGTNAGRYTYKIVKTKNKQSRKFKMCKMAVDAIKEYKNRMNPQSEEEYIFCSPVSDKGILTHNAINRQYQNIVANTNGLDHNKNVTLHGLRHTGISYFLRHGVPVEVVSRMAGHQSIQITIDTYYSVIEEQKIQAVDTINQNAQISFLQKS